MHVLKSVSGKLALAFQPIIFCALMTADFRPRLLTISARLDQLLAEADKIIEEPVYVDVGVLAEELRETLVDMQAAVEQHLDELD
jgi:hypothetical protein